MIKKIEKSGGSKTPLFWENADSVDQLRKSLLRDNLSITSGDTVLGVIANITEKSFQLLNLLKGKREDKPYLVLIGSVQKLEHFIDVTALTQRMQQLITKCWPGPVTIIFKAREDLPAFLTAPDGTIALRCPGHDGLLKLLHHFDGLFSTSANQSGKPVPLLLDEINDEILAKIDHIVVDQILVTGRNVVPSTLLDVSKVSARNEEAAIRVVRAGAYPVEELENYYGLPFKK